MSALRALMADGRWHRVNPRAVVVAHGEADVSAGLMPLHVERKSDRFRVTDKAHCVFCEASRDEIARLKARIAELEGGK